jgi:hypothetical protein
VVLAQPALFREKRRALEKESGDVEGRETGGDPDAYRGQ